MCSNGNESSSPILAVLVLSTFGTSTVATALPFPGLTPRLEVEYGNYSVEFRERSSGLRHNFEAGQVARGQRAIRMIASMEPDTALLTTGP